MQPIAKIFSDMSKSVGAGVVQFAVTLIATPIMTRLYDPAAYATFGILFSIATAAIGIGMLSLPNAYPRESDPQKRSEILRTMLQLLTALAVLAAGAAGIIIATDLLHANRIAPALLPVLILTLGIRQILISITTERADFSTVALGQTIEPLCSRGGSIALGAAFGGHPAFILAAVALGHLTTATILIRKLTCAGLRHLVATSSNPLTTLRRYRDFVVYHTASQQAQPLVALGIQILISSSFLHASAGHYILASSILTLPVSLIALMTAPILYRHFIELERTAPAKLLPHLLRIIGLYVLAGTIILSPIYWFGEPLFRIIFGDVWGQAGQIASILSIAYIGNFALTAVQSIFRVTHRLYLQFLLEVATAILIFVTVLVSSKTLPLFSVIECMMLVFMVRTILLLIACVITTAIYAKKKALP